MILGSFLLFGLACLTLLFMPPVAFVLWLVSIVMFFGGLSSRKTRKQLRRLEELEERRIKNEGLQPWENRFRSVRKP